MSFYPSGGLWQAADSLGMLRQTLDKSDFTNSGRRRRHGSFARLVTGRADVHVVLLGEGGFGGDGGGRVQSPEKEDVGFCTLCWNVLEAVH